MNSTLRNGLSVISGAIAAGIIAATALWPSPMAPTSSIGDADRLLEAAEVANASGRTMVLNAAGTSTAAQTLSVHDVELTLSQPTLRVVENPQEKGVSLLVLTVKVERVHNGSGYTFDIADPCTVPRREGHNGKPTAYLYVNTVHSTSSLLRNEPTASRATSVRAEHDDEEISVPETGYTANRLLRPGTLIAATCRVGYGESALIDLETHFAKRMVEPHSTRSLRDQNVLEFAIPSLQTMSRKTCLSSSPPTPICSEGSTSLIRTTRSSPTEP